MRESKLPNAIIAGVNKAGTTSLFEYLRQHSQIGGSSVKETCYFLPVRYGQSVGNIESYRELFREAAGMPVRLEATPGYFYGGEPLIQEIRRVLGGARVRIIVILRDPVQRLLSFFRAQKAILELPKDLSLREYVDRCLSLPREEVHKKENNPYFGVEGGKYAKCLPLWKSEFGENLLVLFTEQVKSDPNTVLRKTFQFLGVDTIEVNKIDMTRQNRSVSFKSRVLQKIAIGVNQYGESFLRRYPWVKKEIRKIYYTINGKKFNKSYDQLQIRRLENIYSPYNEKLRDQLIKMGYTDVPGWVSVGSKKKLK